MLICFASENVALTQPESWIRVVLTPDSSSCSQWHISMHYPCVWHLHARYSHFNLARNSISQSAACVWLGMSLLLFGIDTLARSTSLFYCFPRIWMPVINFDHIQLLGMYVTIIVLWWVLLTKDRIQFLMVSFSWQSSSKLSMDPFMDRMHMIDNKWKNVVWEWFWFRSEKAAWF